MAKRANFTYRTKMQIMRDCGSRCAFPGCNKPVVNTKISEEEENLGFIQGEISHIYSASKGPRYDPSIPIEEIKSRENGILLCSTHHALVDNNPSRYDVIYLKKIRKSHFAKQIKSLFDIDENIITISNLWTYNYFKEGESLKFTKKEIERAKRISDNFDDLSLENRELIANFFFYTERFHDAIKSYDKLIINPGRNLLFILKSGLSYEAIENYDEALNRFSTIRDIFNKLDNDERIIDILVYSLIGIYRIKNLLDRYEDKDLIEKLLELTQNNNYLKSAVLFERIYSNFKNHKDLTLSKASLVYDLRVCRNFAILSKNYFILMKIGIFCNELDFSELASESLLEALKYAEIQNDIKFATQCNFEIGNIHLKNGDLENALIMYNKMISPVKSFDLINLLGCYHFGRGEIYLKENNYEMCYENLNKALEIYKDVYSTKNILKVNIWIGFAKLFEGHIKEAKILIGESLNLLDQLNDVRLKLKSRFNIRINEFLINSYYGNYEETINHFVSISEEAELLREFELLFRCYVIIGHAHRSKEEFAKSMYSFTQAESILNNFNYTEKHLADIFYGKGTVYYYQKSFANAIVNYEKALNIHEKHEETQKIIFFYFLLYNAHQLNRNYLDSEFYKAKFERNLEFIPPLLLREIRKQQQKLFFKSKVFNPILLIFFFIFIILLFFDLILALIFAVGFIVSFPFIWIFKRIKSRKYKQN